MTKPRIFVASSAENLDVADAINVNLDHQTEVTVWKNGFSLSTNTIDSIIDKANVVDFAIFIFTPDDVAKIRNDNKNIVRDNVLFELGVFVGTLGKNRCFIVKPRGIDLHFPTDLLGLTPADYEGNRSDGDLTSAVNHPCVLIKKVIAELGLISQEVEVNTRRSGKTGCEYSLGDVENLLLTKVLEEYTEAPNGVPVYSVFRELKGIDKSALALASIKLERNGYIERSIDLNMNNEFYVFSVTADGIDYLLENEDLLSENKLKVAQGDFTEFDDDVPF